MAGTDPGGTAWAAAYDDAAAMTIGVTQDVVNGCYQLAALLQQTGFNYSRAESSSTSGAGPPFTDTTAYASCSVALGRPPSAAGHSLPTPSGWWLIEHAVPYVWPGGDQGRLRAAASAWTAAAISIGDATLYVQDALSDIAAEVTPEVDDAMTACQAMDRHLWDLIAGYRTLAGACADFAESIDRAHSEVEHELADLLAWTVGIQTGGALLAVVSFGISEVGAQGAETGRVLATAGKVADIIASLVGSVRASAEAIAAVSARVVEISRRLQPLLSARISVVTTEAVEALPTLKTAEETAVRGLTSAEEASARVDRVLSRLRAGRRKPNLEVDTTEEIERVWADLSEGGTPIQSGFPGSRVELPDGTKVGYRAHSRSGGATIEISKNGIVIKVHLP